MAQESSFLFLKYLTIGFVANLIVEITFALGVLQSDTFPATTITSSQTGSGWRRTEHGWQDSTQWIVDTFRPVKAFELIHPAVWALLVILLVIAATIWASEEHDYSRLFPQPNRTGGQDSESDQTPTVS